MGAWIETVEAREFTAGLRSRPTWARGLKHPKLIRIHHPGVVAPHMGAWIETVITACALSRILSVAPHMGAWIETQTATGAHPSAESRPTWARGLKH